MRRVLAEDGGASRQALQAENWGFKLERRRTTIFAPQS
jgi:hypothetical protein